MKPYAADVTCRFTEDLPAMALECFAWLGYRERQLADSGGPASRTAPGRTGIVFRGNA